MAGEAHLTYGLGYRFPGELFRDRSGYFESFEYEDYFDSKLLYLVEPFHGVESPDFAVLAQSTVSSGDPAEWYGSHGHGARKLSYGLQNLNLEPSEAELEAFSRLFAGLNREHPEAMAQGVSDLELILSITADI